MDRILAFLLTLLQIVCTVLTAVQAMPVYADSLSYDTTDILDDLKGVEINGKPFSITDYPFDQSRDIEVIYFTEYAYSYKQNMRANYGLYIYIYNPKGMDLSDKQSKVQMALGESYEKYVLSLCAKSKGNYNNLFYKFRVSGSTIARRVNSNERVYNVSGVELATKGDNNPTEYTVGCSYIFTGYSKGYGPDANAQSTLTCITKRLETVTLDVKHTFFRTVTSAKGAGYQNQLDTVYFALPKRLMDSYGKLQRIKAEWFEYKTTDMVVTSNASFYNAACSYVGKAMGKDYVKSVGYSLGQDAGDTGGGFYMAKWGWNLGTGYLHTPCDRLTYLFKVNDISSYDPYGDTDIDGNALYRYISSYNKSYASGRLPVKDGSISADLFAPDIDAYRKLNTEQGKIQQGYSYYDFDADVDLAKLTSWSETQPSFWDNWINWGLWNAMTGNIPSETGRTVPPIYTVKDSDLKVTDSEISEKLLVNVRDVAKLRAFYNTAQCEDKVVVLFRFAATDYYSAPVDIIELNKGFLGKDKFNSGQAYCAWESIFLDFDVIQLSFAKDGALKVIPAVANPVDIVNGITPPVKTDKLEWWKILLALALLMLLMCVLLPVINGIVSLVTLPFKGRRK